MYNKLLSNLSFAFLSNYIKQKNNMILRIKPVLQVVIYISAEVYVWTELCCFETTAMSERVNEVKQNKCLQASERIGDDVCRRLWFLRNGVQSPRRVSHCIHERLIVLILRRLAGFTNYGRRDRIMQRFS